MKANEMFNRAQENSIGNYRKVKKNIRKKRFANIPIALITGAVIAISITGCGLEKSVSADDKVYEQYMNITDEYGVTTIEVNTYQIQRLHKLLDQYNIDKYEQHGSKRVYYATADDYVTISELDDSYLCTMYFSSSKESASEMAKALGYESLDDYLIKNAFTDKNGNPNYRLWSASNSILMAQEMTSNNKINNLGGGVK